MNAILRTVVLCLIVIIILSLEVHEEVICLAVCESTRRIDIIAINRSHSLAEMIDSTIRFETHVHQPEDVDLDKKNLYTIPDFF